MASVVGMSKAALAVIACLGFFLASEPGRANGSRNQIVVSPNGPEDGGDYGPKTPGTKTSGVQEALDAAKAQAKDVYLAGGSWTAEQTTPVVYHLHTTLKIPWMQNFRLDSGHCVLNYTPTNGDAVVFDSQMSCSYRLGLIVSSSDGATVRMKPTTAGPDRFKVITSTEFVFNALVGGGGAWPGGEAHNSDLDQTHRWVGTGLWLDGSEGSIDANKITVIETVGCAVGLLLTGGVSRNTIEQTNIHLCRDHICLGSLEDPRPSDNRIEAFMDCQGIDPSSGARVFGSGNLLTLSARPFPRGPQLVFEATASNNLAIVHSRGLTIDRSSEQSNQIVSLEAPRTKASDQVREK
ncbi:MAG: hypothetical protein KDA57_14055 [Planctomycetales bacterium]|nr:hypothetical protein [Planctomycetales bacterium]